jgi:hypothetical protein
MLLKNFVGIIEIQPRFWYKHTNSFVMELSDLDQTTFISDTVILKNPLTGNSMRFEQTAIDYDSTHEDIYGWNYISSTGIKLLIIND